MLNYPETYQALTEKEMEYTSGGSDADFMLALAGGSLAGLILSAVVYCVNGEMIRNKRRAENPEKYEPVSDPAKRRLLAADTKEELMTSPLGVLSLAGFAASAVCIVVGAGISISNMFEDAKKQ